ncbi:hypothetical protein [Streptomyces neyagawaensis]|nr:hypothetical protein [Streptomyces neyagawaensis]MDE1682649.1 hypothetical protein [Streptomyces neyagawaensis]
MSSGTTAMAALPTGRCFRSARPRTALLVNNAGTWAHASRTS